MAAAVTLDDPAAYIIALAVAGFALGAVMPLSIAVGNNMLPAYSGAVSSLLTFSGIIGYMLFPWLIGIISDATDFWYGIAVIVVFPCAITILSVFLPKPAKGKA